MKYLLLVEFLCEVYRREPKARIFLNDQLLDEFTIEQNAKNKNNLIYKKQFNSSFKDDMQKINNFNDFNIFQPKLFEFDIPKSFDKLTIRIEIKNNDNNYTNAFMSRSTQIALEHFYLVPLHKKLIERLQKIRGHYAKKPSKHYAWYQSNAQGIVELIDKVYWKDNEGNVIRTDYVNTNLRSNKLGTDGVFICELKKKYGFYIPEDHYPSYIFNAWPTGLVDYIINKYS